jgi:Cysteine dioxygenase type I
MNPTATPVSGNWLDATRTKLRDVRSKTFPFALDLLCESLASLAWREDCPRVHPRGARDPVRYHRQRIDTGTEDDYQALLIAWPPGHRTPLHDHDNLCGIELVLHSALAVDEYTARVGNAGATLLVPERSVVLGIGDATAFAAGHYVHSCRNLSDENAALSLHVYAGALEHYATFAADGTGSYRSSRCRVEIDAAGA